MNDQEILQYLKDNFSGIEIATANGDSFIYYAPDGKIPEKTFPFATLVTQDEYDTVSNLNRPGIFRLNIGLGKTTYNLHLGSFPKAPREGGVVDTGHDFTALDQIMPHPVYGHMGWICVLNPGKDTLPLVKTFLKEAYESAVAKQSKKTPPDIA